MANQRTESVTWLIADMQDMRISGATFTELSNRAKLIHEQLEIDRALAGKDQSKIVLIETDEKEFEKVLKSIRDGKGDVALTEYDVWKTHRKVESQKNQKSRNKKGINLLIT